MFTSYPSYWRYRTLSLREPHVQGEDVYALQTALKAVGNDPGELDGDYGQRTSSAVRGYQTKKGLVVDGKVGAGLNTSQALANDLGVPLRKKYDLAIGILYGQMAHESSFILGNYSVQYSDGSFDAGVVQRNTNFTPPVEGFDVPKSLEKLAANDSAFFKEFAGIATMRRRWELTAGAWNAPAWARYIAKTEGAAAVSWHMTSKPSDTQRATLEEYMNDTTSYLRL